MQGHRKSQSLGLALAAFCWPEAAVAQAAPADLMALERPQLRGEIQSRYEAALARTQDPTVIGADSPRYLWALQAKAQCGIALGFLRSSHKDPVSIGKCAAASLEMQQAGASRPPPGTGG